MNSLPNIQLVEAIYPNFNRVPFLEQIKKKSLIRTGRELTAAEIGCILSHRQIWKQILIQCKNEEDACLILESDSCINNLPLLHENFNKVHQQFDLFFWGAFDGRMQLKQKGCFYIAPNYKIGFPVVPSLYCTYGYSMNKKVAAYLLKLTARVDYPVDYWKKRLKHSTLQVGGIRNELISSQKMRFGSIINMHQRNHYLFNLLVDIKNYTLSLL